MSLKRKNYSRYNLEAEKNESYTVRISRMIEWAPGGAEQRLLLEGHSRRNNKIKINSTFRVDPLTKRRLRRKRKKRSSLILFDDLENNLVYVNDSVMKLFIEELDSE